MIDATLRRSQIYVTAAFLCHSLSIIAVGSNG